MNYEMIKKNFEKGLWNAAMVRTAVTKGVITEDQYNEIVNSLPPADTITTSELDSAYTEGVQEA